MKHQIIFIWPFRMWTFGFANVEKLKGEGLTHDFIWFLWIGPIEIRKYNTNTK